MIVTNSWPQRTFCGKGLDSGPTTMRISRYYPMKNAWKTTAAGTRVPNAKSISLALRELPLRANGLLALDCHQSAVHRHIRSATLGAHRRPFHWEGKHWLDSASCCYWHLSCRHPAYGRPWRVLVDRSPLLNNRLKNRPSPTADLPLTQWVDRPRTPKEAEMDGGSGLDPVGSPK